MLQKVQIGHILIEGTCGFAFQTVFGMSIMAVFVVTL